MVGFTLFIQEFGETWRIFEQRTLFLHLRIKYPQRVGAQPIATNFSQFRFERCEVVD